MKADTRHTQNMTHKPNAHETPKKHLTENTKCTKHINNKYTNTPNILQTHTHKQAPGTHTPAGTRSTLTCAPAANGAVQLWGGTTGSL